MKLATDNPALHLSDVDYYVSRRVNELVDGQQAVITKSLNDTALSLIPILVRTDPASSENAPTP